MALNIITPAQIITVNAIKLYFYGDPGMYKTTLGMTANKALVIDADKGAYRTGANRRADVVVAECWNDIANITTADLEGYQTVVFDTIGRVLDLIKAHLANDRKNTKGDGSLKLNVQGVANTMFSTFVNKIITSGRDVVFIAHATEDKNDNLTLIRPDLGGKNRQEIYRLCDAMAYLCLETNKQGIQERVLKFESQEGYHSKDAGSLGNVPVPDLRQSQNSHFLGDLIEKVKTTLNTMTPEQQEAQKLKLEWEQWEKSCVEAKYPSDFNALMSELKQEHPNFKNMWECMKHFAYQLGFTYNKQSTKWIEIEIVQSKITDAQRDELQDLLNQAGIDVMTFCENNGIDSLISIEAQHFEAVKASIINKGKAVA
ncbi:MULTISPECIES: ATP-binding protein [unclassified Acinetobacter]|uniref:ATP-binding protein n=1 Tax=unclassified Acinetobacter TaxID=196816 RepID=UPI00293462E3|nr:MULTISPECIES: ATP-binding protein [unclassified Acinetobacter]WOE32783.1 ATP-binding protein [Acinetobacter sp. SAAs470]WOE38260.1 ATP-binding protein [Acinetobacter sp. SAAs474]